MENIVARATALMAANGFLLVKFGDLWEAGKLQGGGPVFALGILATTLAICCAYGMLMHTKQDRLSWYLEKIAAANLLGLMVSLAWTVYWL